MRNVVGAIALRRSFGFIFVALLSSTPAIGEDFTIQTFAGGGLPENIQGTSAVLHGPGGVVTDTNGNIFFGASPYIILKLDPNGLLTRVAGTGAAGFSGDGGLAINAQLNGGGAIAMDAAGNLYISDNARIRKIQNGIISTIAGGGTQTGENIPALDALLRNVSDMVVDAAGNVYFDALDCSQGFGFPCIGSIRKISNGIVTTIAGNGTWGYSGDGGPATSAQLAGPGAMAVDSAGVLYFSDYGLRNDVRPPVTYAHIRKVQNGIITTVANVSSFTLATDAAGNLYTFNGTSTQEISNGVTTTIAGKEYIPGQSFGENGPALDAILGGVTGVSVDKAGNVFLTSSGQSTTIPPSFDVVRKISNGMITTVAGGALGALASIGDNGPPAGAQLYFFKGANNYVTSGNVAMDAAGNVYVVEFNRIRKISQGVITTVAGTGLAGFSGDGGPATEALLNDPWGIGLDAAGNLYIADQGNLRVREVLNGIITTIAGSGTLGFSGDGGAATSAKMAVGGLAVSPGGDVYVSDPYYRQVVRKISNGTITTVSGLGTNYGENIPATSSGLSQPTGLALDGVGNLYVAETFFGRVRKISNGMISTVAGSVGPSSSDGGPATSAGVSSPTALAVDSLGRLYISEGIRVRRVANGIINTVAGNGSYGYSGDGGAATSAAVNAGGLAIGPNGQVYEADLVPWRVRVLTPVPVPGLSFSATPNPVNTGTALGQTTLSWSAPGYNSLQIFANGSLFADVGSSGSVATGNWVSDGMNFSLVDPATGAPLSTVTVHTTAASSGGQISFAANPNPIALAAGTSVGKTTLSWNAPGNSALQIWVSGVLFAAALPASGTIETGNWVSDGLPFSLIDPATGQTIASVTIATK
jgi:hypothetical protein